MIPSLVTFGSDLATAFLLGGCSGIREKAVAVIRILVKPVQETIRPVFIPFYDETLGRTGLKDLNFFVTVTGCCSRSLSLSPLRSGLSFGRCSSFGLISFAHRCGSTKLRGKGRVHRWQGVVELRSVSTQCEKLDECGVQNRAQKIETRNKMKNEKFMKNKLRGCFSEIFVFRLVFELVSPLIFHEKQNEKQFEKRTKNITVNYTNG